MSDVGPYLLVLVVALVLLGLAARLQGRMPGAVKHFSVVGRGTEIDANRLRFVGTFVIDGTVRLDIEATDQGLSAVVITESGHVEGDLRVANADIRGTVRGTVFAKSKVKLARTARVFGDIHYGSLERPEGSTVTGRLIRGGQSDA